MLTEDGWLRTGDLARKGPLGLLVFEGRSKHVIKHGGYRSTRSRSSRPSSSTPTCSRPRWSACPTSAWARCRPPRSGSAGARRSQSAGPGRLGRGALADYKVPKRFVAVDELPRTGTDKVQKAGWSALFD